MEVSEFINCNIFVSGSYKLNNIEKFNLNLINSHISISYITNTENEIAPVSSSLLLRNFGSK